MPRRCGSPVHVVPPGRGSTRATTSQRCAEDEQAEAEAERAGDERLERQLAVAMPEARSDQRRRVAPFAGQG